jgi:Ca2+-binding EF-hand superfamily protein
MEEFDFAMGLFHQDGKLDLSEFIALELLRLGKVEMGTLDSIRREFDLMDKDRDGSLTAKEVMAHKGGGMVPPKRGKRGSKKA